MVCQSSKKVNLFQFCADLNKKSQSAKGICIYASESSCYALTEKAMAFRGLSHYSCDIRG